MIRILPTDIFVYVLALGGLAFLLLARRREYWCIAWRQVKKNSLAMLSLLILLLYTTIALIDTVHFENPKTGTTISLLDWIATPLRNNVEKTYSAPFATHLYIKECTEGPKGEILWIYPRLAHGGAQLSDPSQKTADIIKRLLVGIVQGITIGVIFSGIVLSLYTLCIRGVTARDQDVKKNLSRKSVFIFSGVTCLIMVILLLLLQLAPYYHILGTDKVGNDVFFRAVKSIRTGLVIGSVTTLIVIPFAIFFGVVAGYFGGIIDDIIQYIYTTLSSIPSVLLIVSFMLLVEVGESVSDITWRADRRLLSLCIIMGITSWTGLCRLIRAETLKLRELGYVQAALSFGVSRVRILAKHIVPNVMHIVLISFILRFSGLVLAEAVLAYIGIGVDPSMESWGNMINTARLELARDPIVWWNLFAAFIFMFGLVLPANIFGDALRDALDPRLKTD